MPSAGTPERGRTTRAVALTEIGVPDHPQHSGVACVDETLGHEGIFRALNAVAAQGRLTRETWEYWTRRAGQEPDAEGSNVRFHEPFRCEPTSAETVDERCYVQLDENHEVWVGKP